MRSGPDAAQLRALWDLSPEMLSIATAEGRFVAVSPAWESTTGWTAGELTSGDGIRFLHPDDQARTAQGLATLSRPGRAVPGFEFRFRTRDGRHLWLASDTRATADGRRIFAVTRDVTARKLAEQALTRSEEQLRHAMDHAPVGMGLTALDGRWIRVNDALCRMLACSRDALLGTTFQALVHPSDVDRLIASFQAVLRDPSRLLHEEVRGRTVGGEQLVLEVSASLVRDEDGRGRYSVVHVQDITGRRTAEERLRWTLEELARSNEDLREFARVASHDLRAPLATVMGYLELTGDAAVDLDADGRRLLRDAQRAAEELSDRVTGLLGRVRPDR